MAKETRRGFGKGVEGEDDGAVIDQSHEDSEESLAKQLLLIEELKKEKKQEEMLNQRMETQKLKYWWENPIDLNQVNERLRVYLLLRAAIKMQRTINQVLKARDLPQKASIPYISKKFWPVEDELSSTASSYDSLDRGTNVGGVVQGGGSSMSDNNNATGSSKMKAKIDG